MSIVKPAGMELRVLKEEDMDSVLELFGFFTREPLMRGAGASSKDIMQDFVPFIRRFTTSGVSVGAWDVNTQELIGMRISALRERGHEEKFPDSATTESAGRVLSVLKEIPDVWKLVEDPSVQRVMCPHWLIVRPSHYGKGLVGTLFQASHKEAKAAGCQMVVSAVVNSSYSSTFERLGYRTVWMRRLDDKSNGLKVEDMAGSVTLKALVKDLREPPLPSRL